MKNLKITLAILSILTMSLSCKDAAKEELIALNDNTVTVDKSVEEETVSGYDIGSVATDFKLKNIDGKMVSLANYKNAKGFIVIFTCNHCPYSVAYEDRIIAIDKKFKEKGYPVIAINPNNPTAYPEDSFDNMKVRAKEKGFTFPYLFDAGQQIYPQYGATKTPHVFLLQKENGKNIVKYIGAIDDNHKDAAAVKNTFLDNAVTALLEGKEIENKKTVAIGCSIKK
ncbi:MAG: redoxin domain-containing protein [Nonlabens sp.]|nr:redoxin domain-containing protein [Nonlabens sp.]MDP5099781.1 redoxin domain-containing protein [Nonlabens sp.]